MISYSKQRKLNVEIADARSTETTLDSRISADDSVAYTDLIDTPTQIQQVYYQATGPSHSAAACVASTVSSGDYWIDSDDNKLYISDGSSWGEIQDNDIATAIANAAQAISDAAGAQGTADGKVVTFYQDAVPTSEGAGDLWIDTNDKNKLYRATGAGDDQITAGEWVTVRDSDIAQAISDAATAQTTADGKIVTFYQAGVPTATDAGDLWIDTDDGNKLYRSTSAGDDQIGGGEWIEVQDTGIADGVAAKALTDLGFDENGNLITKAIPASNASPVGTGLYLGADYLGYFAAGEWTTYMDNSANFYLGGTSGALQWNGSTLSLIGNINITGTSNLGQLLQIQEGGSLRSNTSGNYPYLEFSNEGLQLKDADTGGTVGTAVEGTDKVGFGAAVWIMNAQYSIPWYETKEPQDGSGNDMPSMRFYSRVADPAGGTYATGDICVVDGKLKIYRTGAWELVGLQS